MLKLDQIIHVTVSNKEMSLLRQYAQAAEIGGRSFVYSDQQKRREQLSRDQLIGQIGTYVGNMYLLGSDEKYREGREIANLDPYRGDGGTDVIGANIDFKAANYYKSKDMLDYHLWVQPEELHANTVYILILVNLDYAPMLANAYLVGWATDKELREKGLVNGKYEMLAHELSPLMPIVWKNPLKLALRQPETYWKTKQVL